MEQKKPYTPPTVTDHGEITKKTEGLVSTSFETFGHRMVRDGDKG